jgi:uncharacterized protein YmfQ (DUF2313 family)
MRGSVKANLIVFLIIAVIAFCISSAFATLTIHEDNDSYKLLSLDNDSFEPEEIDYVTTHVVKNYTNTTNTTSTNVTDDIDDVIDNWTDNEEDYEWDEVDYDEDLENE